MKSRRVIGVLGRPGDDPDGREDVLDWLRLKASGGRRVVASERLRSFRGGSASDVIAEWLNAFNKTTRQRPTEAQQRRESLDTLMRCCNEAPGAIFIASSLDALARADREWMFQKCVPQLLGACPDLGFVFSADLETTWPDGHFEAYLLRLGTPDSEEVAQHFRRFEDGAQGKIYVAAGVDYGTLRRLAAGHELALAEVTQR